MSTTTDTTGDADTAPKAIDPKALRSFAEFYPFYLGEHRNRTCRRLHFLGSTLALVCLLVFVVSGRPQYLLYGLLCGYGFAWIVEDIGLWSLAGIKRPLYSFLGDWAMYRDIWRGRIPF